MNNIPALVGSVFMFLSYHTKHSSLLIVGRLIIGVNSGMDPGVSIHFIFRIFGWKVGGTKGSKQASKQARMKARKQGRKEGKMDGGGKREGRSE